MRQSLPPDPCSLAHRAAHDLRTPLMRISLLAGIVREDAAQKLGAEDVRSLEVVERSAFEASALVDRLLALVLAIHEPLKRCTVDVRAAMQRAADGIGKQPIRTDATVSIGEPVHVEADPDMFDALCAELLSSAMARSPDDQVPTVNVTMDSTEAGLPIRLRFAIEKVVIEPDCVQSSDSELPTCSVVCNRHGWDLDLRRTDGGTDVLVGFG